MIIIEIVLAIIILVWIFLMANVLAFLVGTIHLFATEKDITKRAIWFAIFLTTGLAGVLGYLLTRIWIRTRRRKDPDEKETFEDRIIGKLLRKGKNTTPKRGTDVSKEAMQ